MAKPMFFYAGVYESGAAELDNEAIKALHDSGATVPTTPRSSSTTPMAT
jgi:hypothetical protein